MSPASRKRYQGAAAILGAALFSGTAMVGAETVRTPFASVERGIFCADPGAPRRDAKDTIRGDIRVIDQNQPVAIDTALIPALPGIEFGLRTLARPEGFAVRLTLRVVHPPMGNPPHLSQSWDMNVVPGENQVNTWLFEKGEEMPVGPWHFQVLHNGGVLVERTFTVYDPQDETLQPCSGHKVIS